MRMFVEGRPTESRVVDRDHFGRPIMEFVLKTPYRQRGTIRKIGLTWVPVLRPSDLFPGYEDTRLISVAITEPQPIVGP